MHQSDRDFNPDPGGAEDHVPIGQLGAGSEIVRETLETGRPRVVTQHGARVAVILDIRTFDALRTDAVAQDLSRDLDRALVEADGGDFVEHPTVLRELRERYPDQYAAQAPSSSHEA